MHVRGVRVIHIVPAVALALLTGCGGPSGPARPSGPSLGTIVWLASSVTQAINDPRLPLIDAFERAYPSIKVDLVSAPPDTDTKRSILISALSAGQATPDVYLGDVTWPYDFARRGIALPLDHYLPASFWAQFGSPGTPLSSNSLVQAATYRGAIYAVPFFIDEGFLFYRKDLLADAGLKPPATWQQLRYDAEVLKSKNKPYQFVWQGADYEGLTCNWTELLADASGGLPVHANPAAELDSQSALKALQFLRSVLRDGISPATTTTFKERDANDAFDSGQAAFLRGWDASYTDATSSASKIAGKVGVVPPPTFQGQQGPGWSVIGGWDMYINPHTKNLKADLTFITWMTGKAAQRILATQYGEIPANAAVRDDTGVAAGNPVLSAAMHTQLVSRPASTIDYQGITDAIHGNVHAALTGPASAAALCQALTTAARAIDRGVRGTLSCTDPSGGG
jgi:multiple sugar transport system substrate-binding protein